MNNQDDLEENNLKKIISLANKINKEYNDFDSLLYINNNSLLFKYLNHVDIGRFIIPFLTLYDICNFRLTCKDINSILNSRVTLFCYSKCIDYNKNIYINNRKNKIEFKPLENLKSIDDVDEQIENLNKLNNYLNSPNLNLENISKIYKVEYDYLVYHEKHHEKIMNSLDNTLKQIQEEYENTKQTNIKINSQLRNTFDNDNNENDEVKNMTIDELKKEIDNLKIEKSKLTNSNSQLSKSNEELKIKNNSQDEILKTFRNFFNEQNYLKHFDDNINIELE